MLASLLAALLADETSGPTPDSAPRPITAGRPKDRTMSKTTGTAAIDLAERHGLTLSKYADPTEEARTGLSVEEAREIAKVDPALIWIEAPKTAVVETMPAHLCESHVAARNWGSHPANGSERREVSVEEAAEIVDGDPYGYARIVESAARG